MIREDLLPAALKALEEGRLFWVVTDQHGRPSNGGDQSTRMPAIGVWADPIKDPILCRKGYHCTSDPLRWSGCLVWLVEVDSVRAARDEDKIVCRTRRALACVDPDQCIDPRVRAAALRPFLSSADLRGVDLRGADLRGVDLRGADLRSVRLDGVRLDGAAGADLRYADLRDARLAGARLAGADLRYADLRGVDLRGVDLRGVDLRGVDLHGANLRGSYASAGVWLTVGR